MPPARNHIVLRKVMAPSLTGLGIVWACLSLFFSIVASTSFYLPYWIEGTLLNVTDVYFGSFRRCNYPRVTALGTVVIIKQCGRYTTFSDIPSTSWQAATVLVGFGAALALLIGFTATMACCVTDIINKSTAKGAGLMQLVAGIFMSLGLIIYPNGWHSREVQEACGGASDSYALGSCHLSWSYYCLLSSVVGLFLCVGLSCRASRVKSGSYRI